MITDYHAKYFAHEITRRYSSENVEKLATTLMDAQVDMNPHQVEAALFAFNSPLSKGAILAEEVGLGKTIEAGIVLSQFWAERKRRILVILPANLRKQWLTELEEKFFLPSVILEAKSFNLLKKEGSKNPFLQDNNIVLCSYNFAARQADYIERVSWDVVIVDEAHRLRNVYKKNNKTSNTIKMAIGNHKKILLTATPLQNSLLELYGLVSLIDEHTFGDLKSFSAQFSKITSQEQFDSLKQRLLPICKRTLRRQVLEYIRYTKRLAITQKFEPTEKEQELYDLVSNYLQRENIQALPAGQRTLMTLMLRKLLASSTFAIAGALNSLKTSLEKILRAQEKKLNAQNGALELFDGVNSIIEDCDGFEETEDEWEEDELPATQESIDALKSEISDLKGFYDLAVSIEENAKGEKLLYALETGLQTTKEIGGNEKAIIFTESRKTQNYVYNLLVKNGYANKIVLFNGSNSDELSKKIYLEWLNKYKGTDKISGSKTADMRSALVDKFKNDAQIMIATEAGAEGINLQFCSMIINYDLPWNPQRIEQRIGRCHRYGQMCDVVVVNFLNTKNAADVRVFQLLDQKFKLFDGVFGASDDVLGNIESGIDFEKRILKIYQGCRTPEEINKSFDLLQQEMEEQIDETVKSARQKLLENFDEEVSEKLKVCKTKSELALSKLQSMLYELTKWKVGECARFDDAQKTFNLIEQPFSGLSFSSGPYTMKKGVQEEHFYRTQHPLALQVIEEAKKVITPLNRVVFEYTGVPKISILEGLIGKSGFLELKAMAVESFEAEDHLIFSAQTDDGIVLDSEQCRRLFSLNASIINTEGTGTKTSLNEAYLSSKNSIIEKIEARNSKFFEDEIEKLEKWSDDLKASLEIELKRLDIEIKAKRTEAKKLLKLDDKIAAQKEIKAMEQKRNNLRRNLFEEQDSIDEKKENLIDEISKRKNMNIQEETLFSFNWFITDKR